MKNKYLMCFKGISFFYFSLIIMGCDNFTETDLPSTQLYSSAVFEDRNTAIAAMVDIYARIREGSLMSGKTSGAGYRLGLYADELNWYGSTEIQSSFYNNSVLPVTSGLSTMWNNSYSQIYAANAVIEGVEHSSALQEVDKRQLKGEALFVRALEHFYITNLWGDVPYITSTDYRINSIVSRMTQEEIYNHLIEDLTQAALLMNEEYSDEERVRPNSFAAHALLARVYLYAGKWAEASAEASIVLNETDLYAWVDNLDSVFLKGSRTTIFQLKPKNEGLNTDEGANYVFLGNPPLVSLSQVLMTSFEEGDLRKFFWTKEVATNNGVWYHANKYKERTATGSSMEYSILLRLSEQYLIRAEAKARLGQIQTALEDLNFIRHAAGLNNSSALTQNDILLAILRERQVEFFTEYGHRFMDLKRFDQLDVALDAVKPGWDSTDRLLPIPETELSLNPNLEPQNPGY